MAKVLAGILGNVSGKVAGVVGGTWKGINYIRAYAKPGNPNTSAQQSQRNKMAVTVMAAKPFVGPICNQYTDRFTKGMSGFNWIIKNNIHNGTDSGHIVILGVASGALKVAQLLSAVYVTGTSVVTLTWDTSLGVDGLGTDTIIAWARNYDTDDVWFYPSAITRSAGSCGITIPSGVELDYLSAGIMAAQPKPNSPTIIAKISSDSSIVVTA